MDGHSGSDRRFTSIEENAEHIIDYIDENCGGKVLLIGGLSLGAQVLLEILSRRSGTCRYALIESAMVLPSYVAHAMIRAAFGAGYGLIRHRWFSKVQFQSLHIKQDLFEDYYRDTCGIKKVDMIAFLEASTEYSLKKTIRDCSAAVHIFFGQKETLGIKKSAEKIMEMIPGSNLKEMAGKYHGEFSINHADAYVKEIKHIMTDPFTVSYPV